MRRRFGLLLLLLLTSLPAISAERVAFGLREAAPLVYTAVDGGLTGIEFEILAATFQAAGLDMEPFVGSNARLAVTAGGGGVDGFAPVVGTPPQGITLTDSYITYQNVAMTLVGRDIQLSRPADLRSWRVLAFQRAANVLGPEFAEAVAAAPDYREEPTQALQAKGLLFGRYDVVVAETRVLHYHIAQILNAGQNDPHQLPVVEHRIFPPTHYCAGFRDPVLARRFNEGLRLIRENGTYDAILARYALMQ